MARVSLFIRDTCGLALLVALASIFSASCQVKATEGQTFANAYMGLAEYTDQGTGVFTSFGVQEKYRFVTNFDRKSGLVFKVTTLARGKPWKDYVVIVNDGGHFVGSNLNGQPPKLSPLPGSLSKLFEDARIDTYFLSQIIPSLLYGLQVSPFTNTDWQRLSTSQLCGNVRCVVYRKSMPRKAFYEVWVGGREHLMRRIIISGKLVQSKIAIHVTKAVTKK